MSLWRCVTLWLASAYRDRTLTLINAKETRFLGNNRHGYQEQKTWFLAQKLD
jgi:hypothetical protein